MRTVIASVLLGLAAILAAATPAPTAAEGDPYLIEVVETLASPAMDGRLTGTPGHFLSAGYIAGELQRFGVLPLGCSIPGEDVFDYFHFFSLTPADSGENHAENIGRNIAGWLPGTESANPMECCFILCAHYDHVGSYTDEDGERVSYFPGANDNASGVAIVLDIARRFAAGDAPPYPIVLVLFDAEEQGLLGAYEFVENPPVPLDNALVINLDMVGGLDERDLLVAYSATTPNEHPGMFFTKLRDFASSSGIGIEHMRQGWEASDQFAFYGKQVPFIFLFGGATAEYERLTDTADKIDYTGLKRVSDFTWRVLNRLGSPSDYEWVDLGERARPTGGKRGFLGVIPDFSADVEEGMAISGTVPGSPAEKAGLLEGDILIEIDRRPVHDLQALASILRDLEPGDVVDIVFLRDGIEERTTARISEKIEDS